MLEIARTLKRLIDSGRLPRPARDIRFWWANEISAEEQYFADHRDERSGSFRDPGTLDPGSREHCRLVRHTEEKQMEMQVGATQLMTNDEFPNDEWGNSTFARLRVDCIFRHSSFVIRHLQRC